MSVYNEDDTRIRISTLKKENPNMTRLLFKTKSDFDHKICYNNNTIKLIGLDELSITISNDTEEKVLNYGSSPKSIIKYLLCIKNEYFTVENVKILKDFINGYISEQYNKEYIEKLIKEFGKNAEKRIKIFYDSKASFKKLTDNIIHNKTQLNKKLNSSSNPKKIERIKGQMQRFDPQLFME